MAGARDAMIEPTVGLHTSQPSPPRASSRPWRSSSSRWEAMRRARTISYSSSRVWEKQPHRPLSTSTPFASSSASRSWPSTLTQLPQPVPALVHFFTSGTVVQLWSVTAPRIVPLVTLWQEQITASSGSADGPSAAGAPAPAGSTSDSGATGGTEPVNARSVPYASASPTRMPPSSVPSRPITSFLYRPARESE